MVHLRDSLNAQTPETTSTTATETDGQASLDVRAESSAAGGLDTPALTTWLPAANSVSAVVVRPAAVRRNSGASAQQILSSTHSISEVPNANNEPPQLDAPEEQTAISDNAKIQLIADGRQTSAWEWLRPLIAATSLAIFCIWYWRNTTSPSGIGLQFLWPQGSTTISTIGALGLVSVLASDPLISTARDRLRWRRAIRLEGVRILDFIVLSESVSWTTLVKWLLSPFWSKLRRRTWPKYFSFQGLAILR